MSMLLEVNGEQYTNFVSATSTISMEDFGSSFTFIASANNANRLPFKGQESCSIYVDGNKIITGTIENVIIDYDYDSHTIVVSGRGKAADFADSCLDEVDDLAASLKISDIIQKLADSISDLNLTVSADDNDTSFNDASEVLTPSIGQNAFDFADTLCRMKQVLLTETTDGNIKITRTSDEEYNTPLKNVIDDNENNILKATMNYNYSESYRIYIVKSQVNISISSLKAKFNVKDITNQNGKYEDTQQRKGRKFVVMAEQNSTGTNLQDRAKWEADIRRARSNKYNVTVDGYSNNGELWIPNKKINVNDELSGINARMLISSVTYNLDLESGSTTELSITDEDAFTLKLADTPRGENVGTGFAEKFN